MDTLPCCLLITALLHEGRRRTPPSSRRSPSAASASLSSLWKFANMERPSRAETAPSVGRRRPGWSAVAAPADFSFLSSRTSPKRHVSSCSPPHEQDAPTPERRREASSDALKFADTHKCKHLCSPDLEPPTGFFLTALLRGHSNQALYLVRRC